MCQTGWQWRRWCPPLGPHMFGTLQLRKCRRMERGESNKEASAADTSGPCIAAAWVQTAATSVNTPTRRILSNCHTQDGEHGEGEQRSGEAGLVGAAAACPRSCYPRMPLTPHALAWKKQSAEEGKEVLLPTRNWAALRASLAHAERLRSGPLSKVRMIGTTDMCLHPSLRPPNLIARGCQV